MRRLIRHLEHLPYQSQLPERCELLLNATPHATSWLHRDAGPTNVQGRLLTLPLRAHTKIHVDQQKRTTRFVHNERVIALEHADKQPTPTTSPRPVPHSSSALRCP